ncbi:hypothetical protein QUF75_05045 [Desulfococcaceae bacterium HSG7]|nr:hypothetical protein [Desulfococcaceae bacterium HSG7]
MRKLPSIGFIYLIFILLFSSLFINWINNTRWYNQITSNKSTDSIKKKKAAYLEKIAEDYPQLDKRAAFLVEAADIRSGLNQKDKALSDLAKAQEIMVQNDKLKPKIMRIAFQSGNKEESVKSANDKLKSKIMRIAFQSGNKEESVKSAKELFNTGDRQWSTISILLYDLLQNPKSKYREKLIHALKEESIPNKRVLEGGLITAVGFTSGGWTLDGKPGFLLIHGHPDKGLIQRLWLACYADKKSLPITATLEDSFHKITHTFHKSGKTMVTLPEIPAGEIKLFIVRTDKSWVPKSKDNRKLGVRLMIANSIQSGNKEESVKLAKELFNAGDRQWSTISILLYDLLQNPKSKYREKLIHALKEESIPNKRVLEGGLITAIGFTPDAWTIDGKPGYLLIHGHPDKSLIQRLRLTCYADTKALPVTATIEDSFHKITHTFHKPGRVKITLPEISANEIKLFIVRTDKSWVPKSKDNRQLGVHVQAADSEIK